MINFILLLIAGIGFIILAPITYRYTIIKNRKNKQFKNKYRLDVAIVLDVALNVIMQYPLNKFMINQQYLHLAHKYGKLETMSRAIGKNKILSIIHKLPIETKFAKRIGKILNRIEPNHVEKAAQEPKTTIKTQ